MKEFIVIVGTIILGIALVAVILTWKAPAETIGANTTTKLNDFASQIG